MGKETPVVRSVLDALELVGDDGFFWRNNTGAVRTDKRFIRYGCTGSPDVIGCYRGRWVGFECKTPLGPRGGGPKQSEEQIAFQNRISRADGVYAVVRNAQEALEVLRNIEEVA